MKIKKKYIVNLSDNFETDSDDNMREIIESIYFKKKPTKKAVKKLMKNYKCKFVHVGTYYKKF